MGKKSNKALRVTPGGTNYGDDPIIVKLRKELGADGPVKRAFKPKYSKAQPADIYSDPLDFE